MILHLDADAFFASVEQAADSRLRGKPVAVGGQTRGVVASASYEARRHGVASAMPVSQARRLCPRLAVVPGDFEKYEHFSEMMFSYARDFTPIVEVGSIDEGYADLRGQKNKTPRDIAETIRRAVHETLHITLSGGLASNKLAAQVAGKSRKPDALVEVPPGGERAFLAPLANHWLPGVGPTLGETLRRAGLPLIRDIAASTPADLALFTGKSARTLWEFANGIDPRPITPDPPAAQSRSAQQTFEADTTDEAFVLATLRSMADRLFAQLRTEGRAARTLAVRIRYSDFAESRRSLGLGEPVSAETAIYGHLAALLKNAWHRRAALRLVSLQLSNLYTGPAFADLPLIAPSKNHARLADLAAAVDRVRAAHGHQSLLRGHDLWLRSRNQKPREPATRTPPRLLIHRVPPRPEAILHVRSCYSFLDSLLTPQRIVQLAAEAGCRAIGICDPNLHAAVPFCQAARAAGLKPLIGAELPIGGRPRRLFAQDETGYRNLCLLLSQKTITPDLWHAHRQGLIESTNPAPPIRCESPDDELHLRILRSIRRLELLPPAPQPAASFAEASCTPDDLRLADSCGFEFTFHELSFPRFHPPDACTPREFLTRLARTGLARRYGPRAASHHAQLETELSMIAAVGYEEYFLTVWDLLQ
ncbi:MAG: PHP domain-containing protein, partial [Terrimicrobiaceae bacterium]